MDNNKNFQIDSSADCCIKRPKISVVTVFNDSIKFKTQLQSALNQQDIECELIAIDNTDNKFKSAASAYNWGGEQAQGEVIIFTHQDISFKMPSELRKFADYVMLSDKGDILGAAGVIYGGVKKYNVTSGKSYYEGLRYIIDEPTEAFSLDEVFIGMKKSTFQMYYFNENICDNWHLYAVEICLHAITSGHKIYIIPIQLHHYSKGNVNSCFYKTAIKLVKHYSNSFNMIWSTCLKLPINKNTVKKLRLIYIRKRAGEILKWKKIKNKIKSIIKKG